jgi:hypothetical protein
MKTLILILLVLFLAGAAHGFQLIQQANRCHVVAFSTIGPHGISFFNVVPELGG